MEPTNGVEVKENRRIKIKAYTDITGVPKLTLSELLRMQEEQEAEHEAREDILELLSTAFSLADHILYTSTGNPIDSLKNLFSDLSNELDKLSIKHMQEMDMEDSEKAVEVGSLRAGDVISYEFPGDSGVGRVSSIKKNGNVSVDSVTMEATEDEPVVVVEMLERVDDNTYKRTGVMKPKRATQINHYRDVNVVKMYSEDELKEIDLDLMANMPDGFESVYTSKEIAFYKNKEGELKFFGVYSNKYEDRDKEILTEASHKDFVDAVDINPGLLPKLWFWHINKDLGQVDNLIWSDYGFILFAGRVYKEFTPLVEDILTNAKEKGVAMGCSHGFYILEQEKNYIKKYRSREISFLPNDRASNLLTIFDTKEITYE